MAKGRMIPKKRSQKIFAKTARPHKANHINPRNMRGGIRW